MWDPENWNRPCFTALWWDRELLDLPSYTGSQRELKFVLKAHVGSLWQSKRSHDFQTCRINILSYIGPSSHSSQQKPDSGPWLWVLCTDPLLTQTFLQGWSELLGFGVNFSVSVVESSSGHTRCQGDEFLLNIPTDSSCGSAFLLMCAKSALTLIRLLLHWGTYWTLMARESYGRTVLLEYVVTTPSCDWGAQWPILSSSSWVILNKPQ